MTADRSAFLAGALAWIYPDATPSTCPTCGFDWSISAPAALEEIKRAPARCAHLLGGRDGMAPARQGGWNATSYLWHLTDLARSWTERWVQLRAVPGSRLPGWDPDELAEARNYRALPTVAALWALPQAVTCFVEQSQTVGFGVSFEHGDWGAGNVADGIRWLGHEFVHHQLDVAARTSPSNT